MKAKVAVVGGGSTGTSILYHLVKRGVDALLIERSGQIAAGQTSRSTALIRTHYSTPVVANMALLSYNFFKRFEEELPGYTSGYTETGLLIGGDERSEKGMKANIELFRRLGITSRLIDEQEVRKIEPMLDPYSFTVITYEPNAGYAEPSTTAGSFASAAQEFGARVLTNTSVLAIEKAATGYELVTSNRRIEVENVVIATGAWSRPIFEKLGIKMPLRSIRHPVIVYQRPTEYQGLRPVIFDFVRSAYYKPEGRHLFFVGSLELELDTSSKDVDPDNYNQEVTFDEIEKFSVSVSQAIPIMAKGGYDRAYTGIYDNTPDQQPIIDEFSEYGYRDLFCVTGLSGHGFKLCPEFGRIISSLIIDGHFQDYDISIFRLKRFENGRLLTGKYHVSTIG